MKIILIGSIESAAKAENYYDSYIDTFNEAIGQAAINATIDFVFLDDLVLSVGDGNIEVFNVNSGTSLSDYDLIFVRGLGFRHRFDELKLISVFARERGIQIINDYSSFRDSSKLGQAVKFHELDLPVSSTVFLNRAVLAGNTPLPFGFPCIMKASFGAHGNDNYLVHSLDEIKQISAKSRSMRFVLQRFVKNEGDFRILVIGDEVIVIGRRAVGDSHLNNTSQGASAEIIPLENLSSAMIDDAKKVTASLDMTFAGVDAIIDVDTGDYYFLEVNSQPQLMSGAFVDVKTSLIAKFLTQASGE